MRGDSILFKKLGWKFEKSFICALGIVRGEYIVLRKASFITTSNIRPTRLVLFEKTNRLLSQIDDSSVFRKKYKF